MTIEKSKSIKDQFFLLTIKCGVVGRCCQLKEILEWEPVSEVAAVLFSQFHCYYRILFWSALIAPAHVFSLIFFLFIFFLKGSGKVFIFKARVKTLFASISTRHKVLLNCLLFYYTQCLPFLTSAQRKATSNEKWICEDVISDIIPCDASTRSATFIYDICKALNEYSHPTSPQRLKSTLNCLFPRKPSSYLI